MNLSGNPIDFVLVFFYGVLASFSPCVYPLLPVSIGYIGASSAGSRFKGFLLGLAYVAGIAVTYACLGLVATFTGGIFGSFSTLGWVRIAIGAVIIVFGLSMLDLFSLPAVGLKKLPVLKKKNYVGVFFLGLSSGLLISPCLTPMLGAILSYLATKKNLLYGSLLLFSFAFGMGFIFILAATSSAFLSNLPKSGKWTVVIKKVCAFIVLLAGVYFVFTGIRRV